MSAPIGNNNHGKAKRWASAIERALARKATGETPDDDRSDLMKGIDEAADAFVTAMFENKDLPYFKEFGDRIDGRPAQALAVSGDGEGGPIQSRVVVEFVNKAT